MGPFGEGWTRCARLDVGQIDHIYFSPHKLLFVRQTKQIQHAALALWQRRLFGGFCHSLVTFDLMLIFNRLRNVRKQGAVDVGRLATGRQKPVTICTFVCMTLI